MLEAPSMLRKTLNTRKLFPVDVAKVLVLEAPFGLQPFGVHTALDQSLAMVDHAVLSQFPAM